MKFWDFLRKKKQTEKQKVKTEARVAVETAGEKTVKEEKEPLLVTGQYALSKTVIVEPVITEKSRSLLQLNQYVFKVNPQANRREVKEAVERLFNVKVENVNLIKLKKRVRGRLRIPSVRPLTKKAVVTIKQGQQIPIFE